VQTISGRCPAERLARAAVQLGRHRIKVLTRMDRKVGALGKVLPQQAVGVLVRAALPGAAGVAEVDRDVGGCRRTPERGSDTKGPVTVLVKRQGWARSPASTPSPPASTAT
jgi:hypothetical protein